MIKETKENISIVNPLKTQYSPDPGYCSIIVSINSDILPLCKKLEIKTDKAKKFFHSKIYFGQINNLSFSITGPVIGSPYAVILLENLIVFGAKKFLFLGWCGSISDNLKIGDIVLPDSAISDEGTSPSYNDTKKIFTPKMSNLNKLKQLMNKQSANFQTGNIWTTDALYRETKEKVTYYKTKGAIAVDMETSALFNVAEYRNVEIASILVVSDEIKENSWHFKNKKCKFSNGLNNSYNLIFSYLKEICSNL